MKRKRRLIWVILALIAILGIGTTSVAAKATKTSFEGEAWITGLIDPGTETYHGINRHRRGMVFAQPIQTDEPRVTGEVIVVWNGNFRADTGVGPMWGTYRLVDDEGQVLWEGTGQGYQLEDGSSVVHSVGHGRGDFKGLELRHTIEFPPGGPFAGAGKVTGYILDPHGE